MKKIISLMALSGLMASGSAMAWESQDGAWSTSGSVALSSEYVWRGVTQSDSEPAISGSFDLGHTSGFYAGVWASSIDFDGASDASTEIDYYAGFSSDIGDSGFSYDVGALYYDYPGASDEDLDFTEVYGFLSYSFLTAGVAYTIDADFDDLEDSLYYSLDAGYDVGQVNLSAGVGYYDYDSGDDYTNYYVAAATELAGFGFELKYTDTNDEGEDLFGDAADDTVIFTISKSL